MVWNTYQCYLKAALTTISSELAVVEGFGRSFGAKIVRGAYMEKERKLARERDYEDPVNETYEATGEMYNAVIKMMLEHIAAVGEENCNMVCATHNEAGATHAAAKVTWCSENDEFYHSVDVDTFHYIGFNTSVSVPKIPFQHLEVLTTIEKPFMLYGTFRISRRIRNSYRFFLPWRISF